jgi:hypothetical protein
MNISRVTDERGYKLINYNPSKWQKLIFTNNSEVEEEAHLRVGVELTLVAAGVGGAQPPDPERVPRRVRARTRGRRAHRHARVCGEHRARVRQDLQVLRSHPRHLAHTGHISYPLAQGMRAHHVAIYPKTYVRT